MSMPDIPKKQAARIRGAQKKVEDACSFVASYEHSLAQAKKELAEFNKNPVDYARRHYGNHAVDSYPVQTRLNTVRDRIRYYGEALPKWRQKIKEAVLNLDETRSEVLAEITTMRPTAGRVPWPKPIASVEHQIKMHRMESDRLDAQVKRAYQQRLLDMAEERRIFDEDMAARQALGDEVLKAELANMTLAERAEWRSAMKNIADALGRKEVGLHDIGDYISRAPWRKN